MPKLWAVSQFFINDLGLERPAAVYLRRGGPAIFSGSSFGDEARIRKPPSFGNESPVFGFGACMVTPFFYFHGQPHCMRTATEATPNRMVRGKLKLG